MMMDRAFAGIPTRGQAVDLARAQLLFPHRAPVAPAIFKALWDAKFNPIEAKALFSAMPELVRPREACKLWGPIEYLHRFVRDRDWPIRIRAEGSTFRMECVDPEWRWQDLVPDSAVFARLAFPSVWPNTARVLGSLLQEFGKPVPIGQIAMDVERMTGRRPSPAGLQLNIAEARNILSHSKHRIYIKAIRGLGYELSNEVASSCLADRFNFAARHGELSVERIAAACDYLRVSRPMVGLVFLILWDRRDEVVARETLQRRCDEYTGEDCTLGSLKSSIRHLVAAEKDLGLGFSVRHHIKVGYQIQTSAAAHHFDRKVLSHRGGLTFHDKVAQLATRLPNARCSTLIVLQTLRSNPGRYMTSEEIISSLEELGIEITFSTIGTVIPEARRLLKLANAPVDLPRKDNGIGYCLYGDIEGWLAGECGALRQQENSEPTQLPPRSVPSFTSTSGRYVFSTTSF